MTNVLNVQKIKNVTIKNVYHLISVLLINNAVLVNYARMENVSQENGNAPIPSVNQPKNVYMENVLKIMSLIHVL